MQGKSALEADFRVEEIPGMGANYLSAKVVEGKIGFARITRMGRILADVL